MQSNRKDVAKKYILYRDKRNKKREQPWEMTELQEAIFKNKYEFNNEGMLGFFNRVCGNNQEMKKLMMEKKFLSAGRILANRGLHKDGKKITYSNCYVLTTPEDNLESIFDTAKNLARTFSYGGGVGIDISKLRPRNAVVNNSAKYTTGAVSFMDLFSLTTGLIGQNNRRGALMISIDCNHPDLDEFIDIKNDLNKITKANISIKITNDFMMAVFGNEDYDLEFKVESTGEVIKKTVNAKDLFYKIAKSNWNMAEPKFWAVA
jgi:ribonucleoside-diphosphate reductase alpha chain